MMTEGWIFALIITLITIIITIIAAIVCFTLNNTRGVVGAKLCGVSLIGISVVLAVITCLRFSDEQISNDITVSQSESAQASASVIEIIDEQTVIVNGEKYTKM